MKTRVMVVNDSAVARHLMTAILNAAGDFDVVETVADGATAVERARRLKPDLITMDLQLRGLDGIEATRRIMRECPTAVAIVSATADLAGDAAFRALDAGALAVVERPMPPGHPLYLRRRRSMLAELRAIHRAQRAARASTPAAERAQPMPPTSAPRSGRSDVAGPRQPPEIIAIAASTGGPMALRAVLSGLPRELLPPIVIVQHLANGFVDGLARWLSDAAPSGVDVARGGEELAAGRILVAPDDRHLAVGAGRRVQLERGAPIGGHYPAATVLFQSVAEAYGPAAVGVVLTGMGRDGATGLSSLRQAGGLTIAQDKATSVVFGMADAAIALAAIDVVLPLHEIGKYIGTLVRGEASGASRPKG